MIEPVRKYRDEIVEKFRASEEKFAQDLARLAHDFAKWKNSHVEVIQKAALAATTTADQAPPQTGLWDIDDEKENAAPMQPPPAKKAKVSAENKSHKSPVSGIRTPLATKPISTPQVLNASSKASAVTAATSRPRMLQVYDDSAAVAATAADAERTSENTNKVGL